MSEISAANFNDDVGTWVRNYCNKAIGRDKFLKQIVDYYQEKIFLFDM